jgi:hypothetical protein
MADASGNASAAAVTNAAAAAAKLPVSIAVPLADLGFSGTCTVRDLWTHQDLGGFTGQFAAVINSHGAGLYRVTPSN